MEHGSGADTRAEMPGVGGDCKQRLGGDPEQQVVDHGLVLVGDRSDLGRQREDHMEIADRQQVVLGIVLADANPSLASFLMLGNSAT